MQRPPIMATVVVLAATAAMVGLGIWQLQRRHWKEALIARYAANASQPPIAFPDRYPIDEAILFRRSSALCGAVAGWDVEAGRDRGGTPGWRHIARCTTEPGRPAVRVDLGVSANLATPSWAGGAVSGMLTWAPEHGSAIARLWRHDQPRDLMIIADRAAPRLQPSAPPSVADIPNNHLSYAIQWFLFAATAAVIYGLALRGRMIADRPSEG
jgi:cytochrome oxidase assembly protein ShyY1